MSQKERVDLIEVDLLDMCKYILSKWVFILIGMVVFAGAGFGYAKVKSVTEYSSKMQVYVTLPKSTDKEAVQDNASELASDYVKLLNTDIVIDKIAKVSGVSKKKVDGMISAEVIDGTRLIEIKVQSDREKNTNKISKNLLPVFQNVVVKQLGKEKPIIVNKPSKIEVIQSVNEKKYMALGGVAGVVLVIGALMIVYLVKLTKEA